MRRLGVHGRLRQARYHGTALTLITLFYLPPAVYTLVSLARIV